MLRSDFLILGAGASGLLLAYRMAKEAYFDDKTIIIIDQEIRNGNDRTWAYWEEKNGEWDALLEKSWDHIYFGHKEYSKILNIKPYRYKMLRSKTIYKELWTVIQTKKNITFYENKITKIESLNDGISVHTDNEVYHSSKVFNSIPQNSKYLSQNKYPLLQQHFIGWFIKTEKPCFDDSYATFMDFQIPQKENTRFMYVLPINKNEALIEYTLFSKTLLAKEEYEHAIKEYLSNNNITKYSIIEKEKGVIPMTCYPFSKQNSKHLIHIGTSGGWTKASTGYTFLNCSIKTKKLITHLKHEGELNKFEKKTRFWFYDLLFLDVLSQKNSLGHKLFSMLFKNVPVSIILKFLNEKSNLKEDFQIMRSVPVFQFLKALIKRLLPF